MVYAPVVLETRGALPRAIPINVMTYLPILCATLALTSAQETIIQNKNINIIVNVDPEEVAKELWKVIEARLNNGTDHPISSWNAIRDLEKVVTPLVSPSRRSSTQPSAYQVANELDRITRRALTRDSPGISLIDEEIMTRDIVADMMVSLKMIQSRSEGTNAPSRRMYDPVAATSDDERDDYVNIRIKIRRRDILNAFH
ncbi:uncharacterized protein LOC116843701 [Odontomachus brunneus]|uniref:uncharacterized protein LOC116843701 n=1 Tax=Odontomachus brunneus TaxID=486640 RepID=UPI0013F1C40E|nr:uncharacterized protein LOC116843701 [Odontomachus brunneus]